MTNATKHAVHKAVNRPRLFAYVEQKMMAGIFVLFFAVMFATQSFPLSILVAGGLYLAARRITAREPKWMQIQFAALGRPARFDSGAGKHRPFEVEIQS
jgi:type IV secretory pathway VirB3-like protein